MRMCRRRRRVSCRYVQYEISFSLMMCDGDKDAFDGPNAYEDLAASDKDAFNAPCLARSSLFK